MSTAGAALAPVLNTFIEPGDQANGSGAIVWETGCINLVQKLGVEFTLTAPEQLADITAAIQGTGDYTLGVQSSTNTNQGVVPTSTYLYSTTLTNPTLNAFVDVTPDHWDLPAGTYFLVAEASAVNATSNGLWGYGQAPGLGVVSVQNGPGSTPASSRPRSTRSRSRRFPSRRPGR